MDAQETGVVIGSGIGNFDEIYDTAAAYASAASPASAYKKVSPLFVPRLLLNMAAGHVSMKYGFQGPNHCASTACTTGAHSIGDAYRFLSHPSSTLVACLAGAAESCIHPLALTGFARARSLATRYNDVPEQASRPFDKRRDGFVMSEGAGMLVLEEREHALKRGARIYAEIVGYGCSADAFHATSPREDGAGALLAMQRALRDAGRKPREVGYINAHATGTSLGDAAEASAIRTLMLSNPGVDGLERAADVIVSSTKGATGHLLGAAGAIEAVFATKALETGLSPPTINLEEAQPDEGFNYLTEAGEMPEGRDLVLSNSFGFGGTNASLVFAKHDS
jgi:3-oxoacyl-[acyl-carrier-protein] synthase II